MRARLSAGLCLLGLLAVMAAGCSEGESDSASSSNLPDTGSDGAEAIGGGGPPGALGESTTPMDERVATLGLLNKRNNLSEDIELKPGESSEIGPVIVTLAACERTAPWEMPQETGAFVQVDVLERGDSDHTRVFSGWLFRQSPSLNVVEHPIYDVWVKDCAMSFPGDEGDSPSG